MKITALGVNSAFSAGAPVQAPPKDRLLEIFSSKDNFSKEELLSIIEAESKKLFLPKWQSNFLIEFDQPSLRNGESPTRIAFDAGSDFKNSLAFNGMNMNMIDGYFVSHPHGDHIGGFEGIALSTFFNPFYSKAKAEWLKNENIINKISSLPLKDRYKLPDGTKPQIYGHKDVLDDLWKSLRSGLSTLQGVRHVRFETFFERKALIPNERPMRFKDGNRIWTGYIILATHVVAGDDMMPSYGIMFECSDGQKIFMPSDTQIMAPPQIEGHYRAAQWVFMDNETSKFKSGVHPHIDDLRKLEDALTKKMIIYHHDIEADNSDGKFHQVARTGDTWEF